MCCCNNTPPPCTPAGGGQTTKQTLVSGPSGIQELVPSNPARIALIVYPVFGQTIYLHISNTGTPGAGMYVSSPGPYFMVNKTDHPGLVQGPWYYDDGAAQVNVIEVFDPSFGAMPGPPAYGDLNGSGSMPVQQLDESAGDFSSVDSYSDQNTVIGPDASGHSLVS